MFDILPRHAQTHSDKLNNEVHLKIEDQIKDGGHLKNEDNIKKKNTSR